MKEDTEVRIFGQVFRLKGEDPQHIREVAQYVDQKMAELADPRAQGMNTRVAVLAALNIAEEYLAYQEKMQAFAEEMEKKTDRMLKLTGPS